MKMINFINGRYLMYGGSIIFGRGLEYLLMFYMASYLTKDLYGQYEYYKKIIEFSVTFFSFGIPTLLLTYPKTKESKVNFSFFGLILNTGLVIILYPCFVYFNIELLMIPILFFSLFHYSGSIIQSFNLVFYGSNFSSYYKIVVSIIFNVLIFLCLSKYNELSLVRSTYFILPVVFIYYCFKYHQFYKKNYFLNIKRYFRVFMKLLLSSFTIVFSKFLNFSFLYTDIFIIKLISDSPNQLIADYAFSLNVANILIIIPLTIAQVEIESLKSNQKLIFKIVKKINTYVIYLAVFLLVFYIFIVKVYVLDYQDTILLFFIILIAKMIQATTVSYGFFMLINKKYIENMYINVLVLVLNIVISYFAFHSFGVIGIAFSSLLTLQIRKTLIKNRLSEKIKILRND
jgi:O-antigen/teichoic acid export membrane protein